MIGNLFKKTTPEDILKHLKDRTFKEAKINTFLKDVDINLKFSDGENFLHKVIPHNVIESIKSLIAHNININTTTISEDTALHISARYAYTDTLKAIISANPDLKAKNSSGKTALHEAVINGRYENYLILSKLDTDYTQEDNNGNTLLMSAINSKNKEIIEDLLNDKNIKPDKRILFLNNLYTDFDIFTTVIKYFDDINIVDEHNRNLLYQLVKNGMLALKEFEYLIEMGININNIDENGDNVLLFLIKYIISLSKNRDENTTSEQIENLINLIPVIIEEEIDTTTCNNEGENALTLAINALNKDILNILLDYDVDPNTMTSRKETALSIAAVLGNEALDLLYLLLDYGASPNIKDENGLTIIEKLIDIELFKKSGKKLKSSQRRQLNEQNDYLAILDAILANSEVHLTDYNSKNEPYIFEPMSYGNIYLIKLLLKYGADINQRDENGLNIIYKYMAENKTFRREIDQKNYYSNLKSIIGLGANINAKDSFGGITLHKAILDCDIQTVKIILHSGADINAVDNRGRNMIHNCMWQNKIKTFRLIYTFNKKLLNEADKFGVLPINYAAFLGYKDLVLELIRTGSHINNPHKKTPYIINFLKRFHESIGTLKEKAVTKAEKATIDSLLENMKKEFKIDSI